MMLKHKFILCLSAIQLANAKNWNRNGQNQIAGGDQIKVKNEAISELDQSKVAEPRSFRFRRSTQCAKNEILVTMKFPVETSSKKKAVQVLIPAGLVAAKASIPVGAKLLGTTNFCAKMTAAGKWAFTKVAKPVLSYSYNHVAKPIVKFGVKQAKNIGKQLEEVFITQPTKNAKELKNWATDVAKEYGPELREEYEKWSNRMSSWNIGK